MVIDQLLILKTDNLFDKLDKSYIKVQLAIPLKGNNSYMYITGEYDILNNIYLFNIESDMRLDEEDYLNITNGSTFNTKLIDLTSSCLLYVYTTDTSVTDSTNKFLYNEIYGSKSHVVFSKESIILEFGKPVKNIWNRMYNTYTN